MDSAEGHRLRESTPPQPSSIDTAARIGSALPCHPAQKRTPQVARGALTCPQPSFGEMCFLRSTLICSTRVGSVKSTSLNAARRCPLPFVFLISLCHEWESSHFGSNRGGETAKLLLA